MKKRILSLFFLLIFCIYPLYNFFAVGGLDTLEESAKNDGVAVLKSLENYEFDQANANVEAVQKEKQKQQQLLIEQQEKKQRLENCLAAIDSGKLTYRKVFSGVVIAGDSLMEGLNQYKILNPENMVTQISASLFHLEENTKKIIAAKPKILILHYGLNHIGNLGEQLDDYIELYKKALKPLMSSLKNTEIVISGTFPLSSDHRFSSNFNNITKYNVALKAMCKELGLTFLYVPSSLSENDEVYEHDGMHMKKCFYTSYWLDFVIEELELY